MSKCYISHNNFMYTVKRVLVPNGDPKFKIACRENAVAITKLEEALLWLSKRREERERRGVEGTNAI